MSNNITTYRKDYQAPNYWVDSVELAFLIEPEYTIVKSNINFSKNFSKNTDSYDDELILDGVDLELIAIKLDGMVLKPNAYKITSNQLTIRNIPDKFQLAIEVKIYPAKNTQLEGLYQSGRYFLTQCEAEGFRKITYYPDRPDVLAPFSVTIIADKIKYPVLLSNGNALIQGDLKDGKHYARWTDPFPKPCYLFALVAGELSYIEDSFQTLDAKTVQLRIYTEQSNIDSCDFAMQSLIKSMQWDESRFGLVYDLGEYNIVATDHFNMGAMENKGLNIFNSKYVLARPDTATDQDFMAIEAVIGHEYFHNWTGNRVTCRDWFQLSLKEGLTVFRDQEFTADMHSRAVKRIEDVKYLRTTQFAEDAGPMSHSVRPDSYQEINNFYTLTVYEKGSEVVRMYHTLLGESGFQKGMKLYFARHDGKAVSCDDFRNAMSDANNKDLQQFDLWYAQNGTPEVNIEEKYNSANKKFEISVEQIQPASYQNSKPWMPMHIPMKVALYQKDREACVLDQNGSVSLVLEITQKQQTFVFDNIEHQPIVSLFQGFSAPVIVNHSQSMDELVFLMKHDLDSFNRWDAAQKIQSLVILTKYDSLIEQTDYQCPDYLPDSIRHVLLDINSDPALITEAITLPSLSSLMLQRQEVDIHALYDAKKWLIKHIVERLHVEFLSIYNQNYINEAYKVEAEQIAKRNLKTRCLAYLMESKKTEITKMCLDEYREANNFTEKISAFSFLIHHQCDGYEDLLAEFYEQWKSKSLVTDRWLAIQASSPAQNTLEHVKNLMSHEAFSLTNPNAIRGLIATFCGANITRFHAKDGSGYEFLADQVIVLDKINPQIASRLASVFNDWKKFDRDSQKLMRQQLERISDEKDLSRNVYEIVEKSLNSG